MRKKERGKDRVFAERGEESEHKLAGRGDKLGRGDEEFGERAEGRDGIFSIIRLFGILPVLLMYSAIFGFDCLLYLFSGKKIYEESK